MFNRKVSGCKSATILILDRYLAFDRSHSKMNSEIKIPLNKIKITLLTIGSILFVVAGYFMLWSFIGIIAILFFGATGIYGLIKLFDSKTGLKIDSNGITDNSNATGIGLIIWNDIYQIRSEQVASEKFIMIDLIEPEKYIKKAGNGIKARLMKTNMRIYGTPISITSRTLKYNFAELEKIMQTQYKRNKNAR